MTGSCRVTAQPACTAAHASRFHANSEPNGFNARLTAGRFKRVPLDSRNPEGAAAGAAMKDSGEADMIPCPAGRQSQGQRSRRSKAPTARAEGNERLRHRPTANERLASSSFISYCNRNAKLESYRPYWRAKQPTDTLLNKFTLADWKNGRKDYFPRCRFTV